MRHFNLDLLCSSKSLVYKALNNAKMWSNSSNNDDVIQIRISLKTFCILPGAQWLSGRVFDSKPKGRGFEPHRRHCVVSLSKNINPSLVLVQPRKTRPFIAERLLMGRKESNQTNKFVYCILLYVFICCSMYKVYK